MVLLLFFLAAAGQSLPTGQWQILFDGHTPGGWVEVTGKAFPVDSWSIEGGCLHTQASKSGMQDIRTVASFRSFEFEFEWKVAAGGNSGVKFLIQKIDEWISPAGGRQARARGFEYQLSDNTQKEAADPRRACASLYSQTAPSLAAPCPAGVFHRSRIVLRGARLEHWLDGVKVLERELEPERLRESPIALQNHNSPAWFRNLRIRRLE